MVREPSFCEKQVGLKKGPWTPEEDHKLMSYIQTHGHGSWRALPKHAGLLRCGKSCRLRWTNYLRPGIKRGNFSPQEENSIIHLHAIFGNRWSIIATHLPGRTDNEIKNHWNTRLRKRLLKMGIDPTTHRPWHHVQTAQPPLMSQPLPPINNLLLSLLQPQGCGPTTATPTTDPAALLKCLLFNPSPTPMSTCTNHVQATPPSAANSSPLPAFTHLDPTLLAAAETRIVLDCLKLGSSSQEISSSSDLNHLVTRLLLVKLLQQSSNSIGNPSHAAAQSSSNGAPLAAAFPSFDGKSPPIHSHSMCNNVPLSVDHHLLHNQVLHSVIGAAGAHMLHEPITSNPYINPNFSTTVVNNGGSHNLAVNAISTCTSYQQRLLHALPFLAESMIEPCTSTAAADDLSSNNQLRHSSQLNSSPSSSTSLPHQPPPSMWDNQMLTSGMPLLAAGNLMEELLMKGASHRDIASSSTVNNTSSSSTLSSAAAAPSTPTTNNMNVQDYWSNILNLISPNINHQP